MHPNFQELPYSLSVGQDAGSGCTQPLHPLAPPFQSWHLFAKQKHACDHNTPFIDEGEGWVFSEKYREAT